MNGPTGVIFIDCWDQGGIGWLDQGGAKDNFYINMLDTLSQYRIDCYVFHSTFLSLDYITPEVARYFQELVAQAKYPFEYVRDFVAATGGEKLSRHLLPLASNPKSIFIPSILGFNEYTQRRDIRNWIVVGGHWPICTHTKPLGFNNLMKNLYYNIYSIPSCTVKWYKNSIYIREDGSEEMIPGGEQIATVCTDADYETDTLGWKKLNDNLWQLNTL
jgi:hypothetical protein